MTSRTVAIIGAGIIGCLIARELSAADADAEITVFDRDLAGSGTTRRSAGLSLVKGATPLARNRSAASHRYYADLVATYPDLPSRPVRAKLVLDRGVTPADAGYQFADANPVGAADPGRVLWQLRGCHYTDVYALTQALAALARPRVRFLEATKVTGLTLRRDSVILRTSAGEDFSADQAVIAPGPWLNEPAWRDLVSPLRLRVKKIVAMHLERPPAPDDELLILDQEDAFLIPFAHRGHWLFSYTRLEWDVDPDAIAAAPGLSGEDVEQARACLRPYSPALAAELRAGRVCCDAYSESREPVIAALDPGGRIIFAGAANGSGYRLAPAIAREAVDQLCLSAPGLPAPAGATDDHQHV
jgi:D-arginine dehydrogenase